MSGQATVSTTITVQGPPVSAKPYPKTLLPALKSGAARIEHDRVLLRAVTLSDLDGGRSGLVLPGSGEVDGDSARKAPYHEVVRTGPDVPDHIRPGDLVLQVSAAADPADHTADDTMEYVLVPYDHVLATCTREEAVRAEGEFERLADEKREEARRRNLGLSVHV